MRTCLIIMAVWSSAMLANAHAADIESKYPLANSSDASISEAPSHYCGLYCVFAAAKLLNAECEFAQLLDDKYLPSKNGSSAENVVAALNSVGLTGHIEAFIPIDRLMTLRTPAILHVRSVGNGRKYNHWVLYLGCEGDNIRLYDPPRDSGLVTKSELLSMWDGAGIVVNNKDSSIPMGLPLSLSFFTLLTIASVAINAMRTRMSGVNAILATTALLAIGSHLLPCGFFTSSVAIHNVQSAFFPKTFPVIDLERMQQVVDEGDSQIVDARLVSGFAKNHIEGATSIPITAGYIRLMSGISALDRELPTVIYCQSEECRWADNIANQLSIHGIRNISIYRGGINEWRENLQARQVLHQNPIGAAEDSDSSP